MHNGIQQEIKRLNTQVTRLYRRGQYREALELATQSCDLARQHLGQTHPTFAVALNNLAALHRHEGNKAEAESLYRQAIDIWREAGEVDVNFGKSLSNLAELCCENHEYAKAEPLYRQAAEVFYATPGDHGPIYVRSLMNLALLYHAMEDDDQFKGLCRQVIDVWSEARRDHPDFADTDFADLLFSLAGLCRKMNNYDETKALCKEALDIWHRVGKDHPAFVKSLDDLAVLYKAVGEYTEAERLYLETLQVKRVNLGEGHADYAKGLNNLATLYAAMGKGKYAEAKRRYQEAIRIWRKTEKDHPNLAAALDNLARVYRRMGDDDKAKQLHEEAFEIRRMKLGKDHPDCAISLNNLAELYREMAEYDRAMPLHKQALEIRQASLPGDHPDVAESLNNLALLYYAMDGGPERALPLFRQAWEIRQAKLPKDHPDVAQSLHNLAAMYYESEDYGKAEEFYRKVLEIDRKAVGGDGLAYARTLIALAELYRAKANYDKAKLLLREARDIVYTTSGKDHPDFAVILNNLTVLGEATGEYTEAERLYQEACDILRATGGKSHHYATALSNLALLYYKTGNLNEAVRLLLRAMRIDRRALGRNHPRYATDLNNLAGLYDFLGRYTLTERFYRQALRIWRTSLSEGHPNIASVLNNLACVCAARGREAEATKLMEEAATIHDQLIGRVFASSSEGERLRYLETLHGNLGGFLSLILQNGRIYELGEKPGAAVQAGLDLVLRRKGIGAEALAAQRDAVLGGRYPGLRSKLEELIALRAQIARKTLDGPGAEGIEAHRQSLTEWEERREVLEADLAREIPEMNLAQRLRAADRVAVAGALPEGSALVEFVRFDVFDFKAVPARGEKCWKPARYVAFVLLAREPDSVQMVDLGEAEAVDEMIATFRASIVGEGQGRVWRPVPTPVDTRASEGRLLRERVFDPLLAALDGRKRLFLAPDGDLSLLPFEVLPSGDGACLIDDDEYVISYVSTGRDVLRFGAPSTGHPSESLVAAGPAFSLASDGEGARAVEAVGRRSRDMEQIKPFEPLEHARLEGERIAKMLDVKPLLDKDVLEGRIKRYRSPRILHIATHGFFLPDQERDLERARLGSKMMGTSEGTTGEGMGRLMGARLENPLLRSGLALAGANDWLEGKPLPEEAEDGILTAVDVTGLDLLATDLVVLSACKTGEGEVRIGEGVFGLRRAFVLAGAKTLVMSLWKVPDAETRQLMEAFYRNILDDQPRADALRAAQREIKARHPEPYYWGAFICQGDPDPLLRAR